MSNTVAPQTVLILVHPGSACGSADFNLCPELASTYREKLAQDLSGWTGDMFVIDGQLSDELKDLAFRHLGKAITSALVRSRNAGFRARRIMGCDSIPPHQCERVRAWIEDGTLDPKTMQISLTGAWYNEDGGGCVGDVQKILVKAGFEVTVRSSVVRELDEDPDFAPAP